MNRITLHNEHLDKIAKKEGHHDRYMVAPNDVFLKINDDLLIARMENSESWFDIQRKIKDLPF